MTCCGLIVAAGKGRRFGAPKLLVPLGDRPLLAWTIDAFQRCKAIDALVLVTDEAYQSVVTSWVARWGWQKAIDLCPGGAERADSVQRGLRVLPPVTRLVAIHDGARPLCTPELIQRVVATAATTGAAIPALPARDTIKRGKAGIVEETVDRRTLHMVQTPQVFTVDLIRRAYATYQEVDGPPTDDARLVEALGHPVTLVEGDPMNIKITVPQDLDLARTMARSRVLLPRVGTGYDVHVLVPGRELVLGGVRLEHPLGLAGHSDADVLCHAVGDALLGGAALGDLGTHFPPGDPRFKDVSSLGLLEKIRGLVAAAGYCLGNLDATVVCETPVLAPHVPVMQDNLARALGVAPDQVSVKATTTEGLGFAGKQEGIAAQAAILLFPLGEREAG